MDQKKELIELIEKIECNKALQYLLNFTKAFVERYLCFVNGKWTR